MLKLNAEQQEALSSIIDDKNACQALYLAMMQCVSSMQDGIHTLALSGPDNERELIYRKCRADGAVKLLGELKNLLRL
jgi:hypothetical protein